MSTRTPGHRRGQAREWYLTLLRGLPDDPSGGPARASQGAGGAPDGTLRALVEELTACGLPLAGMMLTRLRATLVFPNGLVACCCWSGRPAGRAAVAARCTRCTACMTPLAQPPGSRNSRETPRGMRRRGMWRAGMADTRTRWSAPMGFPARGPTDTRPGPAGASRRVSSRAFSHRPGGPLAVVRPG